VILKEPTMEEADAINRVPTKKATLYLVATPIGNMGDITLRALEILREVDFVASEDTRKTGLLLKHFQIAKPQIAFHEFNEERAGQRIEEALKQGKSVALVTDAGTPGISDPGYTLVYRYIASRSEAFPRANPARAAASSKSIRTRRTLSSITKAPIAWPPFSRMRRRCWEIEKPRSPTT
jgi:16S rRNA (cytidine(1402)-2'-O)-methyltransferase